MNCLVSHKISRNYAHRLIYLKMYVVCLPEKQQHLGILGSLQSQTGGGSVLKSESLRFKMGTLMRGGVIIALFSQI